MSSRCGTNSCSATALNLHLPRRKEAGPSLLPPGRRLLSSKRARFASTARKQCPRLCGALGYPK